jgi:hypothetical protein
MLSLSQRVLNLVLAFPKPGEHLRTQLGGFSSNSGPIFCQEHIKVIIQSFGVCLSTLSEPLAHGQDHGLLHRSLDIKRM